MGRCVSRAPSCRETQVEPSQGECLIGTPAKGARRGLTRESVSKGAEASRGDGVHVRVRACRQDDKVSGLPWGVHGSERAQARVV